MDAPLDPSVTETVFWWAAQTAGKTEILNNICGFFMHADPSTILMVLPTVELYEAHSKEKLAPMIRDTPVLRRLVKDPKSRDSGNTTAFKRYPGGNMALVGANAPAGLAGRPRRVILQDEVDRFPESAGTEGDPCSLADKRAERFTNAIKVKTSTATVKGLSKIERLFENSDQRKWHITHKACGHEFVLMWPHVQWPDGKPEEAWIECPCCKAKIDDAERLEMVKSGRWIATKPFTGVRGYWLNGLNALFRHQKGYLNRLHQSVSEFLKAKDGGGSTMRTWINTFLAETYEEEASRLDAKELAERGESYTPDDIPEGVLIIVASCDVQRNRIECEFKGWGKDEESWGIRKMVFNGDTEFDAPWIALDEALLQEFTREDGVKMKAQRVFIDMGYRPQRVLSFCAPRIGRGVYPCRGINKVGTNVPPLLPAKPSKNNKARIPHWNIGVTVAKTALHDRIALPTPGARSMHFAGSEHGYDPDYFTQFAAEKRYLKYSFGQPYYVFEKQNNAQRNEALDLNVYALAAIHSLFPIAWTKVDENLKKQATKDVDKTEVPQEPRPRPKREPERIIRKTDLVKEQAEPKVEAPADYTEMMTKKNRPAKFRRGGFVKGW